MKQTIRLKLLIPLHKYYFDFLFHDTYVEQTHIEVFRIIYSDIFTINNCINIKRLCKIFNKRNCNKKNLKGYIK